MPKSVKGVQTRSPQAIEFIRALQAADGHGPDTRHKRNLVEWQFIDPKKNQCPLEDKRYLLEYELAREAQALGVPYRSTATWQIIFGGQFPREAFLSIDPATRHKLLREAFSKSNAVVPLFDPTIEWQGLSYQLNYALRPDFQARLDAMITEAQDDGSASRKNALCAAVSKFMADLPETAYDQSVAHVQMTIRFDYSDDALKGAFTDLLASIRAVEPTPGLKDDLDARLKQLAAARLWRIFGTAQAAQDYLADCGFNLPYADASGWTKARKATGKLLGLSVY